ncbi:integral membrane protein [Rutstroemia sp. NJR-2017a BVV2]|nr:integral membrane protein [Rutstroemia sp. NJR-2017a BVV2]
MCLTAFGCKPIIAAYDLTLRLKPTTRCFPYGPIVLVFELPNAILDAVILILPIFIIHTLHLPLRKKLLLVLLFWTGGFVMITCILRIVYSFDPKDIQHLKSFPIANEWLMIEEGSAIVAACLPTFRPLVTACFKFADTFTERFTSTGSSPRSHGLAASGFSNGHLHSARRYNRVDEDNHEQAPDPQARGMAGSRWQMRSESIPLNDIHV